MAQDISSAEILNSIPARTSFDLSRLWRRQLDHYPPARRRYSYLAITVLSTVVLYYELYVQGAVATTIISTFDVGFTKFVMIAVVGSLLGAFASLAAGLADRWGRAYLVTAQWQRWWFVCLIGQLAFIPMVFVMAGRWSPKRAREDEARHQVYIEQEMAKLGIADSSGDR
ncbi:hypothetical protein ACFYT3_03510 [Nocardia amikacinitolerans]|uniref:hypothetical protein n=1 Tax=Nocardia amikacinitolerans TaxID=756689 RepID=UPI0020A34610|nr:hypothetical protein [Nocardia amikacinitolerans]MCP2293334.1 hypothetical protein [Nocardia amikacinitolerans]